MSSACPAFLPDKCDCEADSSITLSCTAFEAMRVYEKRQESEGKVENHAFAKELLGKCHADEQHVRAMPFLTHAPRLSLSV